jgi:hypothetical protein
MNGFGGLRAIPPLTSTRRFFNPFRQAGPPSKNRRDEVTTTCLKVCSNPPPSFFLPRRTSSLVTRQLEELNGFGLPTDAPPRPPSHWQSQCHRRRRRFWWHGLCAPPPNLGHVSGALAGAWQRRAMLARLNGFRREEKRRSIKRDVLFRDQNS